MLSRRELLAGGAGVTQLGGDAAAAQRGSEPDYSDELRSLRDAIGSLRSRAATPTVGEIRDRQRVFFRVNQRFPECIDVGIRVWERMQDWHIDNIRPLTIQRGGDGRWQMEFIMTVLVLKHELGENEVGQPYDR
jgi:hypothetical protein